jgi:hypothetical protein
MWAYLGSTCPDRPSPEELSTVVIETRNHKDLDSTAVSPPGAGPDPLQRGIANVRVNTSGPVSVAFTILSLHCAHDIVHGPGDSRGDTHGTDFSVDAPGRATSHTSNGATRLREERERDRRAAGRAARKWEMGTLTKSASIGEGGWIWGRLCNTHFLQ